MRTVALLCLLIALAACDAPPQPNASEPLRGDTIAISDAWATPTPGGVDVSAGYLTLTNNGAIADRLVSASSTRARSVDLHEMSMDGGMMRMRAMEGLDIPVGASVTLSSGGTHLMFMGVTAPFIEGEDIPVQLTFAHSGALNVVLPVRRSPTP